MQPIKSLVPPRKRLRLRAALPLAFFLLAVPSACGRHPSVPVPSPTVGSSPDRGPDEADRVDESGSVEEGVASWYGHPYHGRRTANGEIYNMNDQTAAHRTLPFDTWVKVENLENGKSTTVRINDRGPFVSGRIIDLSLSAAKEIDMVQQGTAPVRMTILESGPEDAPDLYTVQVGAFSVEENAERLLKSLAKSYADVFIERAGSANRVRVGRLKTMQEATDLADRLRDEPGVESAMVVRLD